MRRSCTCLHVFSHGLREVSGGRDFPDPLSMLSEAKWGNGSRFQREGQDVENLSLLFVRGFGSDPGLTYAG